MHDKAKEQSNSSFTTSMGCTKAKDSKVAVVYFVYRMCLPRSTVRVHTISVVWKNSPCHIT